MPTLYLWLSLDMREIDLKNTMNMCMYLMFWHLSLPPFLPSIHLSLCLPISLSLYHPPSLPPSLHSLSPYFPLTSWLNPCLKTLLRLPQMMRNTSIETLKIIDFSVKFDSLRTNVCNCDDYDNMLITRWWMLLVQSGVVSIKVSMQWLLCWLCRIATWVPAA